MAYELWGSVEADKDKSAADSDEGMSACRGVFVAELSDSEPSSMLELPEEKRTGGRDGQGEDMAIL